MQGCHTELSFSKFHNFFTSSAHVNDSVRSSSLSGVFYELDSHVKLLQHNYYNKQLKMKEVEKGETDFKIWGFHGGDYEEWRLLECYAVWFL
jgi:hypothetical protein